MTMNEINLKPAKEGLEPGVPTDLRKALAAIPKAKAQWKDLTPGERRDFVGWIDSVKEPETRMGRINTTCSMLATGKRHP